MTQTPQRLSSSKTRIKTYKHFMFHFETLSTQRLSSSKTRIKTIALRSFSVLPEKISETKFQ